MQPLSADTQQWLPAGLEEESFHHCLLFSLAHTLLPHACQTSSSFATHNCSISCSPCFWIPPLLLGFGCLPTHSIHSKSSPNEGTSTAVPFLDVPSYPHLLESKGENSVDVLSSCTLPQMLKSHRCERHPLGVPGNIALRRRLLKGREKCHIEELLLLFPVLRNCVKKKNNCWSYESEVPKVR